MKLIGFNNQSVALLLANYLKSQKIEAEVEQNTEGEKNHYLVVLGNADDFAAAKTITETFLKEPNHPRYQDAAWGTSERVELDSQGSANKFHLKDLVNTPFTALILLVCAGIYLGSILGAFRTITNYLMIMPLPELMESGEWWRIVTPAFIHFSTLHIIFNLLWWWVLGRPTEKLFGSSFLILFLLGTAIASNMAQLLVSGPNFGGLSGVVYALMGFVWWLGWLRPNWGLTLPKSIVGFMLIWLVLGYTNVLWVSMANTAHTVGLISGCVFAWLTVQLSNKKNLFSPDANTS